MGASILLEILNSYLFIMCGIPPLDKIVLKKNWTSWKNDLRGLPLGLLIACYALCQTCLYENCLVILGNDFKMFIVDLVSRLRKCRWYRCLFLFCDFLGLAQVSRFLL